MSIPLWLQHAIDTFGYAAIFVAVAVETMGIPFPGETALLAGAIYAGGAAHAVGLNIVGVIIAAALGAIIGDNIGYTIGYVGGRPLILRLLRLFRIPESGLVYAERYFKRHGDKTVLVGRFFSLLRIFTAMLAGVSRMPRRTFFFWNATGGILWALLYGLIGYFLGRNIGVLDDVLRVMGIGGVVGFVLVVLAVIVFVHRQRHRALLEVETDLSRQRDDTGEEKVDLSPPPPARPGEGNLK